MHATAIVLSDGQEELLEPSLDGTHFRYHAPTSISMMAITKMSRTFASKTQPNVVRILRSWTLQSPFAPKAGLRYDGLYRILSHGLKLIGEDEWSFTFDLARVGSVTEIHESGEIRTGDAFKGELREQTLQQEIFAPVLKVPTCDMLDDWADYQALVRKELDGIASRYGSLQEDDGQISPGSRRKSAFEMNKDRIGSLDSGYYSQTQSPMISSTELPQTDRLDKSNEQEFHNRRATNNVSATKLEKIRQSPLLHPVMVDAVAAAAAMDMGDLAALTTPASHLSDQAALTVPLDQRTESETLQPTCKNDSRNPSESASSVRTILPPQLPTPHPGTPVDIAGLALAEEDTRLNAMPASEAGMVVRSTWDAQHTPLEESRRGGSRKVLLRERPGGEGKAERNGEQGPNKNGKRNGNRSGRRSRPSSSWTKNLKKRFGFGS